jgi:hypothetical protein
MVNKNARRKNTKISFFESVSHIPKTYRYLESFFEGKNEIYT